MRAVTTPLTIPSCQQTGQVDSAQPIDQAGPVSRSQSNAAANEARHRQLKTFAAVHGIVTNFKSSKPGFEPLTHVEVQEYSHWAGDIQRAIDEGTEFPTEEFIQHTARLTAKLGAHQKPPGPDAIWYGGDVGNEIFQKINGAYLEPVLKSRVENFRAETAALPYAEQVEAAGVLLDQLIDMSANVRNMIARMTSSNHTNEIGIRRQPDAGTKMIDACDAPQYKVWKGNVTDATSSIIAQYPGLAEWRADGKSLVDFVKAHGKDQDGAPAIEWTSHGRTVQLRVDASEFPLKCHGSLHASPFNPLSSHYEFDFQEQEGGSLKLDNLRCHHPTVDSNNIVKTGAEDFRAIVNGESHAVVDSGVRSFTFTCANSSTFLRGQQACMEKIFDAALSTQGLKLVRSDAYNKAKPYENPSEDQHALFCTTREEFMAHSENNLSVVMTTLELEPD